MTDPITRVEAALKQLGAAHEPPRGWETRVLAATRSRPRWCLWWFVLPALAMIVSAPLFWPRSAPTDDRVALHVILDPVGPTMRGSSAHVGDRVRVTAAGSDPYRALWVYRNEHELVVACPGGPSCRRAGDATTADLTLLAVGRYTLVAITSSTPLPAPRGAYDTDQAAAREAGATSQSQPLEVR